MQQWQDAEIRANAAGHKLKLNSSDFLKVEGEAKMLKEELERSKAKEELEGMKGQQQDATNDQTRFRSALETRFGIIGWDETDIAAHADWTALKLNSLESIREF